MQFKHSINWFEIPVKDFTRAKSFYSQIFDYEMPEFIIGDEKMGILPHEKDGIGGAIIETTEFKPSNNGCRVYLNGGDDLSIVLARVEKAGGNILLPKTHISDEIGYFATFIDTEGNTISLHSSN